MSDDTVVSTGYERDDDTVYEGSVADYDLPQDWAEMSDEERSAWLEQERCRRQAMDQQTAYRHHIENATERIERRADARSETVDLEDHR